MKSQNNTCNCQGVRWKSFAKNLGWLEKTIPPLPEPTGKVVYVSNVEELYLAVDNLEPYTTIMVKEGTYQLNQTVLLSKEGVTLRGESNDRGKVVFVGSGFYDEDPHKLVNGILIEKSPNITVANLTLTEFNIHGISVQGWGDPTPHGVHIYNVGFINVGHQNIKVNPGNDRPAPEGGIVEYCYFEQTKAIRLGRPDSKGGDYTGGFDAHKIKDWIIRDNVIINIHGAKGGADAGIFIWNNSSGNIVERNLIIGCDKGIAAGNPYVGHFDSYPEGVEKYHHKGGIIRNNFVYSYGDMVCIEAYAAPGVKIYNNTLVSENSSCSRTIQYGHYTTSLEIVNNILVGNISDAPNLPGAKAEIRNNIIGASSEWVTDAKNGDLRLTAQAKEALGAGEDLTDVADDFYGNPRPSKKPDMGAQQLSNSEVL